MTTETTDNPVAADVAPTFAAVVAVCNSWIERSAALGFKPGSAKADKLAMEYICGAAIGAQAAGNIPLFNHLSRIVFIVAVRGDQELRHIATKLA